ncbi:MAG TPA: AraC family transcriptional regulator, partial [Polyangiaceae bacterium]|nr:AraC family transcriptional regulator [Polyangiaceae bacterium]
IVSQMLANFFVELDLAASLVDGTEWNPIHTGPSVLDFEAPHGAQGRWETYNGRSSAKARRDGRPIVTEYAGFYDLFVPIGDPRGPWGLLVTGPFAMERPSASDVLSRWRKLTGNHGRVSDPEFSHYLATTLATTTLHAAALEVFKQLLGCLVELLEGSGDPRKLEAQIREMRARLRHVRRAERMWAAVPGMLDEKTWRRWLGPLTGYVLSEFGMKGPPEHVVVGLLLGRADEADPVDDLIRRDAFQRACVELVVKRGGAVCGRIGDHGVVLLLERSGAGPRVRAKLAELGENARQVARRHGLQLHLGVSAGGDTRPIPVRYQAALSSAEKALSQGTSMLHAEANPRATQVSALGELRKQLASTLAENLEMLAPRFEHYLEAVMVHYGYRFEPTRAHLEASFDQITDVLRANGTLDERSLIDLQASLRQAASEASTIVQLSAAYRRAAADIELAIAHPKDARQDRSIRRAIAFIREHLAEPLSRSQVARVAGFAANYFSKVFIRSERMTFQRYVLRLRLERAAHMLVSTTLSAERIGQLCGFRTRNHFHRAFKQAFRITPLSYRSREKASAPGDSQRPMAHL